MDKLEPINLGKESIRKALKEVEWWKLVHKDVIEKLDFLIEHIDKIGLPFRDAFRAACQLTSYKRQIRKEGGAKPELSLIFGTKLTEDDFQSAKEATRSLLELNDWFDPSEADVQACRLICDHIDILESFEVLRPTETTSMGDKIGQIIASIKKKLEESEDDIS